MVLKNGDGLSLSQGREEVYRFFRLTLLPEAEGGPSLFYGIREEDDLPQSPLVHFVSIFILGLEDRIRSFTTLKLIFSTHTSWFLLNLLFWLVIRGCDSIVSTILIDYFKTFVSGTLRKFYLFFIFRSCRLFVLYTVSWFTFKI